MAFDKVMPLLSSPSLTKNTGARAAAIRALVAIGREPEKVFGGLTVLILKAEEVAAAAKAILQLPRNAWSIEPAGPAAEALVEWVRKVPVANRTSQDCVQVIQAADELASLLPPARADLSNNDSRILGATRLIEAGGKETLDLTAPEQEGSYEFVCTFPGHWSIMRGKLIGTKDVDAYLKANPDK